MTNAAERLLGTGALRLLASARAGYPDEAVGLLPGVDLDAEMGKEEAQLAAVVLAWMVVARDARIALLEGELRRLRDLVPELDIAIIDWVLHG